MKIVSFLIALVIFVTPLFSLAQGEANDISFGFKPDEYMVGRIIAIEDAGSEVVLGAERQLERIQVRIERGDNKGNEITIEDEKRFVDQADSFAVGDRVVLRKQWIDDENFEYLIDDWYRLPLLAYALLGFVALVIAVAGRRGVGALIGLLISLAAIVFILVPLLMRGYSPVLVLTIGGACISAVTILLAHGRKVRSYVASAATGIAIFIGGICATVVVHIGRLFGFGSEEAFYLSINTSGQLDMRGLLLGGIIIGMLGVLDDVTTTQVATVEEIQRAHGKLSVRELYKRGLSVGREHITSLVNTLILAYSGASLPLFILFITNTSIPSWVIVNSEFIAEELVRMLVGSFALVVAVPIATWLGSYVFGAKPQKALK